MTNITPKAGDTLQVVKYLAGFDRRGKEIIRKLNKPSETKIDAVYEDGDVRSREGEKFTVELASRGRKVKTKTGVKVFPTIWKTVA